MRKLYACFLQLPLIVLLCFFTVGLFGQTAIFVSVSGNDSNGGTSWSNAKKTLAGALEAVSGPTHIYMKVGNYTCANVLIPNLVTVTGGYASISSGTDTTQRRYPGINANWTQATLCTILDGNNVSRVATVNAGGKLEGCVITHGTVTGNGGGVLINGGTVQHCAIIHNSALYNTDEPNGKGGGAYVQNNGLLLNCVVAFNTAINGPGVAGTDGTLTNNTITENTAIVLPVVTTNDVSDITTTSASCGGNVISDGGSSVTARGVCWSTSNNPTISNSHTSNGTGTGNFSSNLTGLSPNTTYYVRAYAMNSAGTAYGEERTFTTNCNSVTVSITGATAISYGNSTTLTASGASSYVWETENSTVGTSASVTVNPTNTTTYTVTGTNTYGCTGTNSVTVTVYTQPTVITNNVTDIAATTASCSGIVTYDGGASVTARGVCWSTSHNPTISNSHTSNGTGTGNFTGNLTGLSPNTTYYVRAYAMNSAGTAYGNEVSFITLQDGQPCNGTPTVSDYDGNIYNTVQIGNQCWMKENLRTTHYANGTSIALGSTTSTTTAYRSNPYGSSSNVDIYGYLYNWKAVMRNSSSSIANPSGVQGVCPTGWHVPSDAEWNQLTNYVSGQGQYCCLNSSGLIAKALASTSGWCSTSTTCAVGNTQSNNNATGFGALPAGCHYGLDGENYPSILAYFWSATSASGTNAYYRYLRFDNATVNRSSNNKHVCYSVRCVRN